jgi:hypothetical protein
VKRSRPGEPLTADEWNVIIPRLGMIRNKLRTIVVRENVEGDRDELLRDFLVTFLERRLFKIDDGRVDRDDGLYFVFFDDDILVQEMWRIAYPEKERNLPPGHSNSVIPVDPLQSTYGLRWAEDRRVPSPSGQDTGQSQQTAYIGITRTVEQRVLAGSDFTYGNLLGHCDHCRTPISSVSKLAVVGPDKTVLPVPRSCFAGLSASNKDLTTTSTNSTGDKSDRPVDLGQVPAGQSGTSYRVNIHRTAAITYDGDPVSERWVKLGHRQRPPSIQVIDTAMVESLIQERPHCPCPSGHKGRRHLDRESATGRKWSTADTISNDYDPKEHTTDSYLRPSRWAGLDDRYATNKEDD